MRPSVRSSVSLPSAHNRRITLRALLVLLVASTSVFAHAQNYTSIVVFGDSLSDTGNLADVTQAKYGIRVPGVIADYTDGRFTDGFDTQPAAILYRGVWIEQLAAALPNHPAVKDSLDGGTDYAYGFAMTGNGMGDFTFGPGDALSVNVNNIGLQISTYLATHPKITANTLFVVWGGANDLLNAANTEDVIKAAIQQAANVQRLIQAGATQILVANLPPLGDVPRFNGSTATSKTANQASVAYNVTLAAALDVLPLFNFGRHYTLYRFDVFALFRQVLASPATFGLKNVTDSSQLNFGANPDTYLFWDDLHPTSAGHDIIALAAAHVLSPTKCWAATWPSVLPKPLQTCH